MPLTGIHHSAVVVTDLARARTFYREALGLEEVPTPSTFDFMVSWFAIGDEQIHLLPREIADRSDGGHMALHVTDLDAMRLRLEGMGVETRDTDPIPGARRFFINDPDDNLIELIEWTVPWPAGDPGARIQE